MVDIDYFLCQFCDTLGSTFSCKITNNLDHKNLGETIQSIYTNILQIFLRTNNE